MDNLNKEKLDQEQIKPTEQFLEPSVELPAQETSPDLEVEKVELPKESQPPVVENSPEAQQSQPTQELSRNAKELIGQLKNLDQKQQVKILSDYAFEEGINESVEIARRLDDDYVLDGLHSSLTDQLYQKLIESKKLKKL